MKIINLNKYILPIVITITFSCSKSKNPIKNDITFFDKKIVEAKILYLDGDYQNSLKTFEEALSFGYKDKTVDYLYAAAAALHLNKEDKAKKIILNSIIETNADKKYINSFKEFKKFEKHKIFKYINSKYDSLKSICLNNRSISTKLIDSLIEIDQSSRRKNLGSTRDIDSLNIIELIKITKSYGWNRKGWILLWHQRDSYEKNNYVWSFFKPLINKEIEKGRERKSFWTLFEDENSILKNGTQVYGNYSSQYKQFPIQDVVNIDKLRDSVGLPPLWYLKKMYNHQLPEEYKASSLN
ncbi:hypothetical protein [Tenacibaculum sp.]|uniref:hypothetical protein n=1 Tax=Tenacibaculum sp. TaxID=1906242 RepID=UPI003AA98CD6